MKTGPNVSFELLDGQILYEEGLISEYLTSQSLKVSVLTFLNIRENSDEGVNIKIVQGNKHDSDIVYTYKTERETYANIRK
jgi:hypothetical protein